MSDENKMTNEKTVQFFIWNICKPYDFLLSIVLNGGS